MSRIEIKRFFREKDQLLLNTSVDENKIPIDTHLQTGASGSQTEIRFGSIFFQRPVSQKPWQNKKLGWIPNATTSCSQFMIQVLPSFYQSMYRFCPNSHTFVSQFHAEGHCQYDLHSHICKLEDRISKILSTVNPAAAGKYLDQDS